VPDDKSISSTAGEVWELVLAYVKQETIEPIKGIGRFLGYGAAGAFALGIGFVLLILAGLRILQTETGDAFDGNWSVVPYLIMIAVAGIVAALAARAIGAEKRRSEDASGGNL
jgi:hypothetical protein